MDSMHTSTMSCCCEQNHLCCRVAEPTLPATTAVASASLRYATAGSSRSTGTGVHAAAAGCEDSTTSTCQPAATNAVDTGQSQESGQRAATATTARRKREAHRIDLGALQRTG